MNIKHHTIEEISKIIESYCQSVLDERESPFMFDTFHTYGNIVRLIKTTMGKTKFYDFPLEKHQVEIHFTENDTIETVREIIKSSVEKYEKDLATNYGESPIMYALCDWQLKSECFNDSEYVPCVYETYNPITTKRDYTAIFIMYGVAAEGGYYD